MHINANLVDNDVKYLLCDPAVHGKPRHLTSQLKNVVMFAVPISDKSFNMKINWNVSWRIYWHSYGWRRISRMNYVTFAFENAFGENEDAFDEGIVGCCEADFNMRLWMEKENVSRTILFGEFYETISDTYFVLGLNNFHYVYLMVLYCINVAWFIDASLQSLPKRQQCK